MVRIHFLTPKIMPYKVDYEILYKYHDSGDKFVPHASGRPDVRDGYGMTEDDACSREWFEKGGRNKVSIIKSKQISQDEYNEWIDHCNIKYEHISRNHRNGVE